MTFYVTTPIYYVNSKPHIGHAYTTIAADILTRHHRQRGEETFFLTGVDEHATKVWRVAEEQGLPRTGVRRPDRRSLARSSAAPECGDDFFIRTSDDGHKEFVRDFLQRIYDNGDVYEDVYAGLYCVGCEAFKTEDELVDGKCPDHNTVPEWIEEKNYFFRLSRTRTSCSSCTTRAPTSSSRSSASTRSRASSPAACATSRSAARASRGASRSRGTRARSPTSGPTRSSTT